MRLSLLGSLAAALLLVFQAAQPGRATTDSSPAEAQLVALGLSIYREQYCGVCHTFAPAGSKGAFGPSHDGFFVTASERLTDPSYTGSATTPEAYALESITSPQAYIVPGYHATPHRMPAYEQLTQEELNALVYVLLHAEAAP